MNNQPGLTLLQKGLLTVGCVAAALLMTSVIQLSADQPQVSRMAGVAVLMAVCWITEAIPLAVTALFPVVLLPLLGIQDGKAVAGEYFNYIIFLYVGGFLVALAMQRWNLHKRIALKTLLFVGVHPRRLLLGFMLATAFLSMWISNTATAMMMVTIAMAVIVPLRERLSDRCADSVTTGLLLGVAYAASIGGIATLVGTPPNLSFARILEIQFPDAPSISFASWMQLALPISLAMFSVTWALLSLRYMNVEEGTLLEEEVLQQQYDDLGPASFAERVVLVDFAILVVLWLFRNDLVLGAITIPGWSQLLAEPGFINDGAVAVAAAIPLFLIPSRSGDGSRILDWETANGLPWHIVLLFGGGFALASGFVESGLSDWLGGQLGGAAALPPYAMLLLICLGITFLTELTSNIATTEMILPVLASLAVAIDMHPLLLMVPATISCSCAFMMPVATPPNAIVFGAGSLKIREMVRTGVILNLIGVVVIVAGMWLLGGMALGVTANGLPDWAGSIGETR
ncbi:Sodium-dependent dicarboxylate transporter SdcS [Maioricimonas rarisocia]|uniref:Sodium-dependent dicarboxylate transporter SdcS n=1 Tax=Maioricimonas rarisocia TaxID=2528026 RepID=A0A517Z5V6_9PLAN|nr:SLC13 family permease [Maioricimonas rarisocia]QDU37880.1 Sodium-dependent dicarboxylate transporter SdcS [Maioricimonas rarisocia]